MINDDNLEEIIFLYIYVSLCIIKPFMTWQILPYLQKRTKSVYLVNTFFKT
jgi:hypothetical protein